jgi:hypothetical protein
VSEGPIAGGCACGAVRYRLTAAPMFVNCCHCRQCQKLSGSAFALNAMIEARHVEGSAGEPQVEGGRAHCQDCGTLLWATHQRFPATVLFLRVGTLDEGERLTPDAHFFVRSKHPWIVLPPGTRAFETLPGPGDVPLMPPAAQARLDAAGAG